MLHITPFFTMSAHLVGVNKYWKSALRDGVVAAWCGSRMASPLWIAVLAILAPSAGAQAIQDSRCYLMNGGAVESFFISEDTPVGSVIGTLSVNGDPGASGDISLSLQERDAALAIAPGTKNLTLERALDREEREGPSSLYVNVRCERRRTADPGFLVPVSVRVWDVNDNAPQWLGAPFLARVSELAPAGARVLAAPAADADQPGPHAAVRYSVLPGPHADYIGFANELDSMLVVKKPLDYETVSNFTVRLRAQDQGTPPRYNDTELFVQVLDADDQNPKFTHDHYIAILPDDAQEGTVLETLPGPVAAADQDKGICAPLHYSLAATARPLLLVHRDSGRLATTAQLLQADLPLTLLIKATQVDNADRYALAALEVRRPARAPRPPPPSAPSPRPPPSSPPSPPPRLAFERRAFAALVPEDTPPGAALLPLRTNAAHQPPLQFYVSDKSFLEKFAINNAGEVVLRSPLDYEVADSYQYQVMVTDGVNNDTATVNISVADVNEWEPRFRQPRYEFRLPAGGGLAQNAVLVGRLEVHDGDRGDAVSLALHGDDAPLFYISNEGELFLRQEALSGLNSSMLHVVATATDSGVPPRQTSALVAVAVAARGGGGASGVASGGGRGAALGGLAAALALLALLALALVAYARRQRRRKRTEESVTMPTEKAAVGVGGGAGGGAGGGGGGSSGSLLSVSAGASTILAGSSASLERTDAPNSANANRKSQRFPAKSRVAPVPAGGVGVGVGVGVGAGVGVGVGVGALMSDHVGARPGGRSGVAWPSATIPARVKKLSWDDAQGGGEGGGEGARVNEATNAAVAENMNLTVYF
ncbi:unnamed protein product, partial [Iphiclides podalirius]